MTSNPASEHREIAGAFGALVRSADPSRWDDQSPVPDWRARDVVDHLVTWLPDLLSSGSSARLETGPSAADDPVAAWEHHEAVVQALLDDPATGGLVLTNQHIGEVPVDQAVSRFYTADVFLHTWDLAKATGQQVVLDEARCTETLAGMEPLDQMLRESGQYGPKVAVPADADVQARLMAFIGRDPLAWP